MGQDKTSTSRQRHFQKQSQRSEQGPAPALIGDEICPSYETLDARDVWYETKEDDTEPPLPPPPFALFISSRTLSTIPIQQPSRFAREARTPGTPPKPRPPNPGFYASASSAKRRPYAHLPGLLAFFTDPRASPHTTTTTTIFGIRLPGLTADAMGSRNNTYNLSRC